MQVTHYPFSKAYPVLQTQMPPEATKLFAVSQSEHDAPGEMQLRQPVISTFPDSQ
jgi:hypothetical protein